MPSTTPTLIVLKDLAGHAPPTLDPFQQFLAMHVDLITALYVALWCTTSVILLVRLWQEYKSQKDQRD